LPPDASFEEFVEEGGPLEWSKASCLEVIKLDVARNKFPEIYESPGMQASLTKVLQQWLFSNTQHEHRQGLDTLATPLLCVVGESQAALALHQMVQWYGLGYFRTGGTVDVFKPKFNAIFSLLLYWDPELGLHLWVQDIVPELFAVPWLTTLFAGIFTLQETIYLWDTLVHFPYNFIIAFSVAFLMNVRTQLLNSKDSSDILKQISLINGGKMTINLPRCLVQATSIFQQTPLSVWKAAQKENRCISTDQYMGSGSAVPVLQIGDALKIGKLLYILDIRQNQDKFGPHHVNSLTHTNFKMNILFYPIKCLQAQITFFRKKQGCIIRNNKLFAPPELRALNGYHIGIYSDVKQDQFDVANLLHRYSFTSVFVIDQIVDRIIPWTISSAPRKNTSEPVQTASSAAHEEFSTVNNKPESV